MLKISKGTRLSRPTRNLLYGLAVILFLSYGLWFLARTHFFFDLFSYFTLQYTVGEAFLAIRLALDKRFIWASLLVVVMIANIVEARWHVDRPLDFYSDTFSEEFSFFVLNRKHPKRDFEDIKNYLKSLEYRWLMLYQRLVNSGILLCMNQAQEYLYWGWYFAYSKVNHHSGN